MSDTREELRRVYVVWLTLIMVLGILVSVAWAYFALTPVPLASPRVTITNLTVGKTEVCPGDILTYTYTVVIHEPGVHLFDSTVWRIAPPHQVVEWSQPLRLVAQHPDVVTVTRNWIINPDGVYNTLSDRMEPWAPGPYERHIALTTSGRDALPSAAKINFTIKEGCEHE